MISPTAMTRQVYFSITVKYPASWVGPAAWVSGSPSRVALRSRARSLFHPCCREAPFSSRPNTQWPGWMAGPLGSSLQSPQTEKTPQYLKTSTSSTQTVPKALLSASSPPICRVTNTPSCKTCTHVFTPPVFYALVLFGKFHPVTIIITSQ